MNAIEEILYIYFLDGICWVDTIQRIAVIQRKDGI
jgi:hypothetical protein